MKPLKLLLVSLLLRALLPGAAAADIATGTWEYRGPSKSALWLMTEQTGNTVRFQLEISRGAPSYNSGWIEGRFELTGSSGIFRTTEFGECTIRFEFQRSAVVVSEGTEKVQDCGFGFNVHADGRLVIKSRKKPKFSEGDPR